MSTNKTKNDYYTCRATPYTREDKFFDNSFGPAFAEARKRKAEVNGVPFTKFDETNPSDLAIW